ncbi:MAG: tRNA (adenosine(37)-N6)-threonylcarbamoyltransferase complex ATPase subunit type 1 TsaE [Candidatus Eisenbacteria bacterium]|uniref:tRNA threonylcarbamoyladenosine biosynthesis protein TsaE n=1 Tax=Eiseniibacteriota bacterium TaxID=2212470 RepID=A0A538TQU4_UNCEI|nr:MAG: tRNA (adenosine(37)-N6)-threonylcarbamoyltransferase complex ATPase subunit type 1 TsaE [Candidatus Eisenbacteria bacterium]
MNVELRSMLRTEGETLSLGRHVGSLLKPGDWIALTGELGSGKTTFVSGVLASLHPGARVRSPTYVLVEVYGAKPTVVHADLFRLASSREFAGLGLEDLALGDAVVLVEWADRAAGDLPLDRLDLELRYLDGDGREIRIRPRGDRWESLAREGAFDRDRWHDALYPGN